jgi:hypothetical protein
MQEFCDWDNDGCISYEEVSGEMTDAIINAIENNINNGKTVAENISELTILSSQILDENINKSCIENNTTIYDTKDKLLPPNLLKYIYDTFESYDTNNTGYLDRNEFWQLIRVMNLGLTEGDYDDLIAQWDTNGDGEIDWKESSLKLNSVITSLGGDNKDHWVYYFFL